jgi:hypothetical protein
MTAYVVCGILLALVVTIVTAIKTTRHHDEKGTVSPDLLARLRSASEDVLR